jgi:hypothetical protein
VPSAATAQKNFREAFIHIVTGERQTSEDLAKLDRIRDWERYCSDAVGRRGRRRRFGDRVT